MKLKDRLMNLSMPVTECGCWIFTGTVTTAGGYGQIYAGRTRLAHRVSYELFCGEIPKGLDVMHRCDVPPCINPDHLFLGTRAVNMADMVAKNRQAKGEQNASARLTEAEVLAIRASPLINKEIAKQTGMSRPAISIIRRNKIWRHI